MLMLSTFTPSKARAKRRKASSPSLRTASMSGCARSQNVVKSMTLRANSDSGISDAERKSWKETGSDEFIASMLHIGIVACSAEGAALCYKTICIEGESILGAHAHPEVSLHSHSFGDYMRCIDSQDWQGVAELMLSSAQ